MLRGDETFRVMDTVTVQSKPTPQVNRVERECYTKTELFRQKFNIEDRRGEVEIKVTVESGTDSKTVKGCPHGAITITIYLSPQRGYVGFDVIVAIVPCQHNHYVVINKSNGFSALKIEATLLNTNAEYSHNF